MTDRIEQKWNEFRLLAIEPHVSRETLKHMRRVFYAGAKSIFSILATEGETAREVTQVLLDCEGEFANFSAALPNDTEGL